MKRFLLFLLSLSLIFSFSFSAFAEEADPSEGASGGDSGEEVVNTNTESSESSASVSEPSEGGSGGDSGETVNPVTYSIDGTTVNVSDQSVNAIADAVVAAEVPTISNKNGYSVPLYDVIPDYWDDYDYHVIGKGGNGYWYYLFGDSELVLNTSDGSFTNAVYRYSWTGSSLYEVENNRGLGGLNFYYADFDLKNSSGNLLWSSDTPVFYTVTFDSGFDDLILDPVSSDNFIAPVVAYDGHQFAGWFLDPDFSVPYSTDYIFTSDTTLYAKWIPYITISFITGIEGFELDSVQILSGESYTPPTFTYAGYDFVGSYTDEFFDNQFVGGTEVEDDLTLYLRFEPIVYDYGELMTEQLNRLEGLTYAYLAQSVLFAVVLLLSFFVNRKNGFGI